MDHVYSINKMKVGTIITIDELPEKYRVEMCIDLSFFNLEGYRLNIKRIS